MFVRDNLTSSQLMFWGDKGWVGTRDGQGGYPLSRKRTFVPGTSCDSSTFGGEAFLGGMAGKSLGDKLSRRDWRELTVVYTRWLSIGIGLGMLLSQTGGREMELGKLGEKRWLMMMCKREGGEGGTHYAKQSFNFSQSGGSLTHIFTSFTLNNSIFGRTKR